MGRKVDEMMSRHLHLLTTIRRRALHRLLRCLPVIALLWTLNAGTFAIAQNDDDDRDERAVKQPYYFLSEQQFDQLLLRSNTTIEIVGGQRQVTTTVSQPARGRMENALTSEIEMISNACSLTENQKTKLQLAGRGDIVRFLDHVTDLRRKYAGVAMDRQQYTEVLNELQALGFTSQSNSLEESSLFRRTLRTTLTDEQLAKYQLLVRARKVSVVTSALVNIGRPSKGITLTGETRQKFIDVVVNQGHLPSFSNPYGPYIVLLEVSRLQHLLKPLVTETEWQTIENHVNTARPLEPMLRKAGQWPVPPTDDDDDRPEATKD